MGWAGSGGGVQGVAEWAFSLSILVSQKKGMAGNQKYPIGRQDFRTLRNIGFMYVDKTELIYRLIEEGSITFESRSKCGMLKSPPERKSANC